MCFEYGRGMKIGDVWWELDVGPTLGKPRRLQHTYFPGLGIKNGLCIVSLPCLTDVFVGFLEELEAETTKV